LSSVTRVASVCTCCCRWRSRKVWSDTRLLLFVAGLGGCLRRVGYAVAPVRGRAGVAHGAAQALVGDGALPQVLGGPLLLDDGGVVVAVGARRGPLLAQVLVHAGGQTPHRDQETGVAVHAVLGADREALEVP